MSEKIIAENAAWTFSGNVAKQFSAHIRRSVPMYDQGHELVCQLSDYFVRNDSICYELGVATGELLTKLVRHNQHKSQARWVGIDVEPDMIAEAQKTLSGHKNVTLEVADVLHYEFEKSDLMVSYYCLQFIPPKVRQQVLCNVFENLHWGGAFILFEKVRANDARFQDIMTTLYSDFKLKQGYQAEEILAKTRSLKGILEPFSTQGNLDLLQRAGFVDVITVMKYACFEGFLAIK